MKIINKGRQTGKTSYLINESYKYNYTIIVSNCSKKKTVEYISEKMNKKVKVFTIYDLLVDPKLFVGKNAPEAVLIDDLDSMMDILIEKALQIKVDKVTMSIPMDIESLD